MINLCEKINCPFATKLHPRNSSGCRRYMGSDYCHLIGGSEDRATDEWRRVLKEWSDAYFLYVPNDRAEEIAEIAKPLNDEFVRSDEASISQLEIEKEFA